MEWLFDTSCHHWITDEFATVFCDLPLAHEDDHNRGFLYWDNFGEWYARHQPTPPATDWCENCHWHETEPHPRREGIRRCANCKQYRVRLDT